MEVDSLFGKGFNLLVACQTFVARDQADRGGDGLVFSKDGVQMLPENNEGSLAGLVE